jgi:hypothetical protein
VSLKLEITCPGCKHTFRERASKVKPGNARACPSCGKIIEYTGDDLSKVDRDIKRAMADLKKAFKGSRK